MGRTVMPYSQVMESERERLKPSRRTLSKEDQQAFDGLSDQVKMQDISGSLKTGIPGIGPGTSADTVYGVYGGMGKKARNAMNAAERNDYFQALEFASPSFLESILKG
jgi:hypothetical protein